MLDSDDVQRLTWISATQRAMESLIEYAEMFPYTPVNFLGPYTCHLLADALEKELEDSFITDDENFDRVVELTGKYREFTANRFGIAVVDEIAYSSQTPAWWNSPYPFVADRLENLRLFLEHLKES